MTKQKMLSLSDRCVRWPGSSAAELKGHTSSLSTDRKMSFIWLNKWILFMVLGKPYWRAKGTLSVLASPPSRDLLPKSYCSKHHLWGPLLTYFLPCQLPDPGFSSLEGFQSIPPAMWHQLHPVVYMYVSHPECTVRSPGVSTEGCDKLSCWAGHLCLLSLGICLSADVSGKNSVLETNPKKAFSTPFLVKVGVMGQFSPL